MYPGCWGTRFQRWCTDAGASAGDLPPLQLLQRANEKQMAAVHAHLRHRAEVIAWYLEELVFPKHMRFQATKSRGSTVRTLFGGTHSRIRRAF